MIHQHQLHFYRIAPIAKVVAAAVLVETLQTLHFALVRPVGSYDGVLYWNVSCVAVACSVVDVDYFFDQDIKAGIVDIGRSQQQSWLGRTSAGLQADCGYCETTVVRSTISFHNVYCRAKQGEETYRLGSNA